MNASLHTGEALALLLKKENVIEFIEVSGKDTFYLMPESKIVRFRRITDRPYNLESDDVGRLTFKQRSSPNDISSRTEIEIPIDIKRFSEEGTSKFLTALGGREHFSIHKHSQIYRIRSSPDNVVLDIVFYSVEYLNDFKYFVEVEVENTSPCSDEYAREVLESWVRLLQRELGLEGPLNKSLYEMYAPKDDLFLPNSF